MKVSGSYESVVKGVSEQVPQDRLSGQHTEQVNLISDPVRGLSRRHGSLFMDKTEVGIVNQVTEDDFTSLRAFSFSIGDNDYDLLYRRHPKPVGSTCTGAYVFDKQAERYLPVTVAGANATATLDGGVSTAVSVGKYVFLAGFNAPTSFTTVNKHEQEKGIAVWVRGGAYSRTFKVTLERPDGTKTMFQYKTMPAAYDGTLDTSDIPYDDPNYQKKVNDRTNAYNTAVTQHLAAAAADIQPQNIAEKLRLAAVAAGIPTAQVVVMDTTLLVRGTAGYIEAFVEDGGDGSFIKGAGRSVKTPEDLVPIHFVGKVIRIKPKKSSLEDAMYMEAIPKIDGAIGYTEVTWRECAGVEVTITNLVSLMTIENDHVYIGGSPEDLQTLVSEEVPTYEKSRVGDLASSPLPYFLGNTITYLGVFQDRLVIGSGAVLYFSRTSDYLNFWRTSVADVTDNDPVEVFAQGAAEDDILSSVLYDRNIIFFGRRKQYVVSGRQPLTPKNAAVSTLSAYEGVADSYPVESGNYVFYSQSRNASTSIHQIQMGMLQDTPESYEISQQIDTYIQGKVTEIVAMTSPKINVFRAEGYPYGVYTYSYLDSSGATQRVFDAWSRWEWDKSLGKCCGISRNIDTLFVYTLRAKGSENFLVADKFSMDTVVSDFPYLDSMSPYRTNTLTQQDNPVVRIAISKGGGDKYMYGVAYKSQGDFDDFLLDLGDPRILDNYGYIGTVFTSEVELTNPYPRDRNGKAIVTGRFIIQNLNVSVKDTGGFEGWVSSLGRPAQLHRGYQGSQYGRQSFTLGNVSIGDTTLRMPVGRETREYICKLNSKQWLPMSITAIEYTGNFLNNTRRM